MILEKEQERSALLEANNKQLREEIILRDNQLQELKKESQKKEKEGIRFIQEYEVLLKRVDTLQDELIQTDDDVREIKQKLTKQPKVIHDTTFLS
jgi:chromosome segregation ATPase